MEINHHRRIIMFCPKCGKEIQGNAKFCTSCGEKINTVPVNVPKVKTDVLAASLGISQPMLIGCVIGAVTMAVVSLIFMVMVLSHSGHDMTGTYYTDEFFPISWVSFKTDGTFTTSGGTYPMKADTYGKYSKHHGKYNLQYRWNGNHISPVGYEMQVEKISDSHIVVKIIPTGEQYMGWLGQKADFYR